MTPRRVGLLLRSLAPARPGMPDAELLGRVAAGRDDAAFAALVERHGRLVWAVCRHLAGPDAEDAFQATFLVLFRSAGRVRRPESLGAWLHGVAYRVSARARRAARRRARRERAAAVPDRAAPVPDSAWDRALAAVHEEVARLPEALRVPFILCCLEGRAVTEAAGHLGWKVTTLSARLGRAKETLLARLQARGLAAGAVAVGAIAASAVPTRAARAMTAGDWVAGEKVRFLTHGVIGMSALRVKLTAAGVLVAAGLGVGGGAGWLGTADAQSSSPPPARPTEERVRQLEAQLDRAKRELADERAADRRTAADEVGRAATARWEYAFVRARDVDADGFGKLLQDREAHGWDYTGQATMKKEAVWVFRRPAGGGRLGLPANGRGGPYGPLPRAADSQPGASVAPSPAGTTPVDPTGRSPADKGAAPGPRPAAPGR